VVNEPIAIELQGFPTATLVAADYGVNAYAETIFTTGAYAAEHPDVVKAFIAATAKGWDYAFKNRDETVAAVLAINTELDVEQQKRQLDLQESFIITPDTDANGLCSVETAKVVDTYEILKQYGGLAAEIDIAAMVKPEFNATPAK
jgi:NitT/TauT family transport system substrate-binding protein